MDKDEIKLEPPNKEFILERWFNIKHELKYVVTAKTFKDPTEFFLNEYINGKLKRICKANTPLKFHDKVDLTK